MLYNLNPIMRSGLDFKSAHFVLENLKSRVWLCEPSQSGQSLFLRHLYIALLRHVYDHLAE